MKCTREAEASRFFLREMNPGDGVVGSFLAQQLFFAARVTFLTPGDGVRGSFF